MSADRFARVVSKAASELRLDAYLAMFDELPSRSACVKLIESGLVTINDEFCTSKKTLVFEGDRIVCKLDHYDADRVLGKNAVDGAGALVGDPVELDICYEDDWLLVISKQPGLVCHPAIGHERATLANALVYRYGADNLATIQGEDRPGIVHRLDGDTSGLMICAKDDQTALDLQEAIKIRSVDRRYLALVHGLIAQDSGLIDIPITRSKKDRLKMQVTADPLAKQAITTFKVLERFADLEGKIGDYTLIECKLYTGRTHQIRVHMQYIGHPCVGDPQYSLGKSCDDLGLTRQFLHSYRLGFMHPRTENSLCITDCLPDDLSVVLESLSDYSHGKTAEGTDILSAISQRTIEKC